MNMYICVLQQRFQHNSRSFVHLNFYMYVYISQYIFIGAWAFCRIAVAALFVEPQYYPHRYPFWARWQTAHKQTMQAPHFCICVCASAIVYIYVHVCCCIGLSAYLQVCKVLKFLWQPLLYFSFWLGFWFTLLSLLLLHFYLIFVLHFYFALDFFYFSAIYFLFYSLIYLI